MIGTLINVATVVIGSSAGMLLKSRLPEKVITTVFHVLGLFTLFIGLQMSLKTGNPLIMVLSLLSAALLGEGLDLEKRLERFSQRFIKNENKEEGQKFGQAIVTGFMIFCVGSLTILGCFEEGISGKKDLLITKSLMDLFSSTALASAFGKGILFSVIPLFIYQASLTLAAQSLSGVLSEAMQTEMIACGGILLIGLGLVILNTVKIRIINLLPVLIIAPLFTYLAEIFSLYQP